eukprot:337733_1
MYNKPEYSFGVRFYYHDYFKNNEQVHYAYADGARDDVNSQTSVHGIIKLKDWYIEPKYKNMKEEVLNCKESALPLIEFLHTLKNSIFKLKAFKQTVTINSPYPDYYKEIYGIGTNAPITLNHIIAILFYTNNTLLSAAFSKSYRKIRKNESDEQLKLRHSYFANWGKYLKECVEVYGTKLRQSKISTFYHGISAELKFKGLSQFFCIPTSTTLIYETAVIFAKIDGIVISIENNTSNVAFWKCIKWSEFPGEAEMLFVGGRDFLEISSMTMLEYNVNCTDWIQAIKIFERISRGAYLFNPATGQMISKVKALISSVLNLKNKFQEMPPIYIMNLFKHVCKNIIKLKIDVGLFGLYNKNKVNTDLYHDYDTGLRKVKKYGYSMLKNLYFDGNNLLKLDFIGSLLGCLNYFTIQCVTDGDDGYEYNQSMLITDALLNQILSYTKKETMNKRCPWMLLGIIFPKNNAKSLKKIIKKYSPKFEEYSYMLSINKRKISEQHPELGEIFTFSIGYGEIGEYLQENEN